jgi:hypothetical protein
MMLSDREVEVGASGDSREDAADDWGGEARGR